MPNVRLDGVDVIKSQQAVAGNAAALVVDDVVTKLEGVDLNNGEEVPSVRLNSNTIQDGQVLTYSSGKWVNNDITAAGAAVNNDLGIARTGNSTDIAIEYNFGNNPNTTFLLNGSNASITNLSDGEHMTWDGSLGKWVNSPVMASGGSGGGTGFYVQTAGSDTDYYFNSMPSTSGLMVGLDVQTSGTDTDYVFNSGVTLGSMDTSNLSDGSTAFWSTQDNKWKMSSMIIEEI